MLCKRSAKLGACLALGFTALTALALAKSSTTIVPFKSVGPVKLGMTLAQVKAGFGSPSHADTITNDPSSPSYSPASPRLTETLVYNAPSKQAHLSLTGDNAASLRLDGIDTRASTFKTTAGFGVGSSVNKAASLYPNITCNDSSFTQTFKLRNHSRSRKPASCEIAKHGPRTKTVTTPAGGMIPLRECDRFQFAFTSRAGVATGSVTYLSTTDALLPPESC